MMETIAIYENKLITYSKNRFWNPVDENNHFRMYINKPVQLLIPFPGYKNLYKTTGTEDEKTGRNIYDTI